jgi:hypothetical protein
MAAHYSKCGVVKTASLIAQQLEISITGLVKKPSRRPIAPKRSATPGWRRTKLTQAGIPTVRNLPRTERIAKAANVLRIS